MSAIRESFDNAVGKTVDLTPVRNGDPDSRAAMYSA